jgi:hypothetical protein
MATFADVAEADPGYAHIEACVAAGLIAGTQIGPPRLFSPNNALTHQELLALLANAINYTDPDIERQDARLPQLVKDVPPNDATVFFAHIQKVVKYGVVGGPERDDFGVGMLSPLGPASRGQCAVWMTRAAIPLFDYELANPTTAQFSDVPVTHPKFRYVETFVALGITAGIGGGLYGVNNNVLRYQYAIFLRRLFKLPPVTLPVPSDW